MRVSGGLECVRELGGILKTESCISRFIYPDTYSPVSAAQLNVLPPLARCLGVKESRSGEGTINRNGVRTYTKAKHTSGPQRTTHSGRLGFQEGEKSQRAYSTRKLQVVITTYSYENRETVGVVHLCEVSVGQLEKVPAAPFPGWGMGVTGDSESASDEKNLTPAQWKIYLGK